ncbi:MAG TPA: DUF2279 domain-containing protein [Sphingobium sp.]|nr:DUF2279 domain-containing protein [Sphingobium sp.]
MIGPSKADIGLLHEHVACREKGRVNLRAIVGLTAAFMIGTAPSAFAASPADIYLASDFKLARPAPDGGTPEALAMLPDLSLRSMESDAAPAPYNPASYDIGDPAVDKPRPDPAQFRGFGRQLGAIKWEMVGVLGYYTAINGRKLFHDPEAPHFHREGWFGKSTKNLGVDKLAHAYSAYVISDLLYARLKYKTGNAPGIAATAAILGSAMMLYTELWDSIEPDAGWSWEDVAMNSMGAGFSLLRNSVPGLDRKLDFRLMIVPNSDVFTASGKRHFEQQHYFFALKLAGFEAFEQGPLRLLELHAGYYGKDFTLQERAMGVEPKRRLFVGVGINLRELFFKNARSRVGRAVGEVLDYYQPPYTALHRHVTN